MKRIFLLIVTNMAVMVVLSSNTEKSRSTT